MTTGTSENEVPGVEYNLTALVAKALTMQNVIIKVIRSP